MSVLCLGFAAFLAAVAYSGSKATGAGAAQGDLGFFLVLRMITPAFAILVAVTILLEQAGRRSVGPRLRPATWALSLAAVLVMAWNWLFLFYFWKA